MKRSATAQWAGDLKSGKGKVSVESKLFENASYSFHSRFEEGTGTNPEELIAAAHAGCYAMALSHELDGRGMTPENVDAQAEVILQKTDDGFSITRIDLHVDAHVPDADEDEFQEAAEAAKNGCPVSKVLNAEITLNMTLNGHDV